MAYMMIKDIKMGVSNGGMACGPVGGHAVAEICIHDLHYDCDVYHSLAEVEGTLNFTETDESTFDIQINEDDEDKAGWETVTDGESGGFSDYEEFYDELQHDGICNEHYAPIWRCLVYLVRADDASVEAFAASNIGKCLEDITIPVCDAEQEYLDDHDLDELPVCQPMIDEGHEEQLYQLFCERFIGKTLTHHPLQKDDEGVSGYYTSTETILDGDYNEFKYNMGYELDAIGTIISVDRVICRKLLGEDAASSNYIRVSA